MDLSCIILSGDLELYVLGMLPKEEAGKIEQLAKLFPEVQAELDRISESLEALGNTATAAPSASVKDNLMKKLRTMEEEEQKVTPFGSVNAKKIETDNSELGSPVRKIPKRANKPSWLLAASFIGLIVSVEGLVYYFSQNKQSQTELAALQHQVDTLRSNSNSQQQRILAYSQTMQMMHDATYKKIELTNVPGKPSAMAQVLWNTKTKEVFIADVSLPQAPSDKQYQLWAIVDGKPVDAGMLGDAKNLAQRMKVFERAEMFAITLEQKGGSPTPTMEEMYVAGKV